MAPCSPNLLKWSPLVRKITATPKFDTGEATAFSGLEAKWVTIQVVCRYPQSTRIPGKITNIADYGAFVEPEPGIEGLRTCPDGLDQQERGPFQLVRWATKLKSWS
jgi:hypothetical protein